MHCIRSYTRRCMNIHQRDHFNKLYHGTNEVIHELCEEGPYQEGTHAPCMRHVKKDYEVCAARYQSTMAKIGQTVATTTTTTVAASHAYPTMATHPAAVLSSGSGGQYHSGDMSQHQHHHHRQQHEHPGRSHPNSTKSIEDAEEERLKTVCCAFQKYMQCSEFTVRHACGDETALFTRKFLDKMSNTLMRLKRNPAGFSVVEFIKYGHTRPRDGACGRTCSAAGNAYLIASDDSDADRCCPIAPGTISMTVSGERMLLELIAGHGRAVN
uniref:Uncharacterized protein n=1 Tax=Anopheles stephensi TaxID=30069 RepID=A0A182YJB9_ANOST